jgi:hypothetical protein
MAEMTKTRRRRGKGGEDRESNGRAKADRGDEDPGAKDTELGEETGVGLMKELLLLPVAPVRGTLWVAERIGDEVERGQRSGGAAVEQLDEMERAKERGELDEQEAAERQEQIVEQQVVSRG